MHRCLTIYEVQSVIFREIYDDWKGKTTIARLARTCRTFSNTALDVLWKELDSIVDLIRCLPMDLLEFEYSGALLVGLQFKRAMSPSDWEIFYRYSSRVQSLSAFGFQGARLADDVTLTLSHPPADYSLLFPRLETLRWTGPEESLAACAPLLHVLLQGIDSLVNFTLPSTLPLSSRGSSSQDLRIHSKEQNETSLSEIVLNFHSLKSLTCCVLNKEAISHLSRLPSLVKLDMELQDDFRAQSTHVLTPPMFASLESLTLRTKKLSTFTTLLKTMRFQLRSIAIRIRILPHQGVLNTFFMTLVDACDPQKLTGISLTMKEPKMYTETPCNERSEIGLSTFRPLLTLHNTTSFTFDVMCNISLDDESLETLASSWPKLTNLSLNESFGWGEEDDEDDDEPATGVTHRGLVALLSHCPALENFVLAVSFKGIDVSNNSLPTSRPGKGVTSRCRTASFIEPIVFEPVSVAAFLSDVLPMLRNPRILPRNKGYRKLDGTWSEQVEEWDKVCDLLPALSAVRYQGIKWGEEQKGGRARAGGSVDEMDGVVEESYAVDETCG